MTKTPRKIELPQIYLPSDYAAQKKIAARLAGAKAAGKFFGSGFWQEEAGFIFMPTNFAKELERKFGIPEVVWHVEQKIFHSLPPDIRNEWPERLMTAASSPSCYAFWTIWPKFAEWLLIDPEVGIFNYFSDRQKSNIEQLSTLIIEGKYSDNWFESADWARENVHTSALWLNSEQEQSRRELGINAIQFICSATSHEDGRSGAAIALREAARTHRGTSQEFMGLAGDKLIKILQNGPTKN